MEVRTLQKPAARNCCDSVETRTVERVALATLPTEWGDFQIAAYRSLTTKEEFVASYLKVRCGATCPRWFGSTRNALPETYLGQLSVTADNSSTKPCK